MISTSFVLPQWMARVVEGLREMRSTSITSAAAMHEECVERAGGHTVAPSHRPHLLEALDWLVRAQDATRSGGFARGYSLVWNADFASAGWQPEYPETTGQIVVTLYGAARHLHRADLASRATRAARWLVDVQRASGALQSKAIARVTSPAVFHTGQVLLAWLSAFRETGDGRFLSASRIAGRYLVSALEDNDRWKGDQVRRIDLKSALLKARASWPLAEAGEFLRDPALTCAAARYLKEVAALQRADGWIPATTPAAAHPPLLHTLAHAIRGLLEGGRVLQDDHLIGRAALAAEGVASAARKGGRLPGRFGEGWTAAATWSCLAGQAQMVNVWLRLFETTGETKWLEPVPAALRFLKSSQNRNSRNAGLRGGIKGSVPFGGPYGRYQVLNWATSLFVDAMVRHERVATGTAVVRAVASATRQALRSA